MSANLGPVRPPLVYLGSILLGLLLHFTWPLPLVQQPVGTLIGAGVVLMAVGLFITAVRTFRGASTPVPGNRPTTTIVRTGPYRLSRNPPHPHLPAPPARVAHSAAPHHRTARALPPQPQPHLPSVLGPPGRHRPLRGQPVVAHHARSG